MEEIRQSCLRACIKSGGYSRNYTRRCMGRVLPDTGDVSSHHMLDKPARYRTERFIQKRQITLCWCKTMNSRKELVDKEVATVNTNRPHVVVLGAGASRACCLQGDKNGRQLPLMNDLVDTVGLRIQFENWGIDPEQNFEDIFSDLYEKNDGDKLKLIQQTVEDYFNKLVLLDKPTLYDHLILSLRKKDLIATFNWDPLLLQAYNRSRCAGLELPDLVFLHGNVGAGYCKQDKTAGLTGERCGTCGAVYKRMPLLYPTKIKSYAKDPFIHEAWRHFEWSCQRAFILTIFGYGAPKTDTKAISIMKKIWRKKNMSCTELLTFITDQSRDDVRKNWRHFFQRHHYYINDNFYSSFIANHPRRTCESYRDQSLLIEWRDANPIPRDLDIFETWKWFSQFKKAEGETSTL